MDMNRISLIVKRKEILPNGNEVWHFDANHIMGLRLTFKSNGQINRGYLQGKLITTKQARELDCRHKRFCYDVESGLFDYSSDVSIEAVERVIKALEKL